MRKGQRRCWDLYKHTRGARSSSVLTRKREVQALNRTQPMLRVVPGVPLRRTTSVQAQAVSATTMCALDVASGKVITKMTVAHRAVEFIEFLELIDKKVPKELKSSRRLRQLRSP